jgi:regulatory protein
MPARRARRITPDYLHNAALFYLGRYAASRGRLGEVLRRKAARSLREHPDQDEAILEAMIVAELARLEAVALLDDRALAAQCLEGYQARGMPRQQIIQRLIRKGFDRALIAEICGMENPAAGEQELAAATRYLLRRRLWPAPQGAERNQIMKHKKRAWAALARQGYEPETIQAALGLAIDQAGRG